MEQEKSKEIKISLKKVIILTIIVLLVLSIAVFGMIYYNAKNKSDDSECENAISTININEGVLEFITPTVYKPIIYIYPEEETEVTVELGRKENLTCTYPVYEDKWKVTAKPDGTLKDEETRRTYYALYWEGINIKKYGNKLEEGFVVKGEDTIKFLEDKLEILGLNEKEAEEFIIYWLPKMQNNKYNYIRFQTMEEINENMPIEVTPKPETLIRVMMEWKSLNKFIEVKEQKLEKVERKGYTVVEWGGTEIK